MEFIGGFIIAGIAVMLAIITVNLFESDDLDHLDF